MNFSCKDMNIFIVGSACSFPHGYGASARICQYALGLSKLCRSVNILCLQPSELPDRTIANSEVCGRYHGVSFEYTPGTTVYSRNRLGRRIQYIKGIIGAYHALNKFNKNKKIHIILFYGTDFFFYSLLLWIYSITHGSCFIGENTEAPFVNSKNGIRASIKKWLVLHIGHKLFDGFVVISSFLENKFRLTLQKNTPIIQLPIMIHTKIFENIKYVKDSKIKYLIYCGNLNHKGEVEGVLSAWAAIKQEFPDWHVRIIGDCFTKNKRRSLDALVHSLDIEEDVEFMGLISRERLVEILMQGDVMLLPRSDGLFSRAGLPNKLGEYLATGKPVIVTKTGDIERYLTDRFSAYLVRPDDVQAFSDTMRYVMSHQQEASQVGLTGRKIAKKIFDTDKNSKRFLDFAISIYNNKYKFVLTGER
jgi:glycosyltransferase involved in cell wall biosynthesis